MSIKPISTLLNFLHTLAFNTKESDMTKNIFHKDNYAMSVTIKGQYPTHSVVGTPLDFYAYLSDKGANSWSEWIKGEHRLYRDLSELHRKHDLEGFVSAVEKLWQKSKKP